MHRLAAGDVIGSLTLPADPRSRATAKLSEAANVVCCFEAGRNGFWLHRVLSAHNVDSHVVDPTSLLVNRRAKRARTDRLDAEGGCSACRPLVTTELIRELDAECETAFEASPDDAGCQKITSLRRIHGVGENFTAVLVCEVPSRHLPIISGSPAMSA